jgi:glycosyltransferase involved in cell wall biosynthesis
MKAPKITIITPSYNQGHFLEQTIRSVLDQQYPSLEYLIYDGDSKDNSVSIIKAYETGITAWVSEKDKGQSDAINKGFKKASGDIINWLNSDDYYEKGSLQHVATQFDDPAVNCYTGISRIFGGTKEYLSAGTDLYAGNLAKTIGWARIDQPETYFRKAAIDEIGYLNECLHFVMDKDLWIRFLSKNGLSGIRKDKSLLVHFRLHGDSKTVSLRQQFDQETKDLFFSYAHYHQQQAYVLIFEELWNVKQLPLQYYPEGLLGKDWEQILNYFLLHKGLEAYALNNYKEAAKILQYIKLQLLDPSDQAEFQRVRIRMKLLPKPLKILLNHLMR